MFADQLSKMSNLPYSHEIENIVMHALFTFKSQCSHIANKGGKSIETFLQGDHGYDYGDMPLDFGDVHFLSPLKRIPENLLPSVLENVINLFAEELEKGGFKNINVQIVLEGPFYDNKFIFGRKSIFKDKSNPKYSKKIKISASW